MSNIPVPGPVDDDGYENDNYEADQIWGEWNAALEWAIKGDHAPLVECLRRPDLPLNNEAVRTWLADGLALGRFKKPNKVAVRPERVEFEIASGRRLFIYKRHLKQFEAMRRAEQLGPTRGEDAAIKEAAKEFGMKPKTLRNYLTRPRGHWGLHPVKHDGMFDGVAALLKIK